MEEFQVVIVGGGVTGLGLAKASVNKGYKTLLLEKGKLGEGVSDNSLRIMHAGFRYFQQLNLKRVVQSIKAEGELRELYPEIVSPLKCHMKLKKFGLKTKIPLTIAGLFYSTLSNLFIKNPNPTPKVVNKCSSTYFRWYDSLLLDHKILVNKIICELKENNNFTLVEQANFLLPGDNTSFSYQKEGEEISFFADYLINTSKSEKLNYVKAINVIVPSMYEDMSGYAYDVERRGLYFSVPRDKDTSIGTWYFDNQEFKLLDNEREEILSDLKLITGKEEKIIDIDLGFLPVKEIKDGLPKFYGAPVVFKNGNYFDYNAVKYTTFLVEGQSFINSL